MFLKNIILLFLFSLFMLLLLLLVVSFVLFCLYYCCDRVFLCRSGCPGTLELSVNQVVLELLEIPLCQPPELSELKD